MAKNDKYYENVKEALQKEGWIITHSPFRVRIDNKIKFKMDLGAERTLFEFENTKEKIVVEIKSFLDPSFINDFHDCVGQYNDYLGALEYTQVKRKLWLAIPHTVYMDNFMHPFIISQLTRNSMSIVTFDPTINRIVQWIPR
jgi:hypothetical protein